MRYAVTGAGGFLGWHVRCGLRACGSDVVAIDRQVMSDPVQLADTLVGADAVLHLAGVNRAQAEALRDENLALARNLTAALDRAGARPSVVYANSIQSGNGTPFGDGKQAAAEHLAAWGSSTGAPVADVHLPNLFGEHGKPKYNSVVATFSHELATGGQPTIVQDRDVPLLHVQDAVDEILKLAEHRSAGATQPGGRAMSVSALLELLTGFRDLYTTGEIPDLNDPLHLALFNTYRSYCFPAFVPIHPPLRADNRGHLFECIKGHGGQAQVFCSTSHPGMTRGEHFHRRRVERFIVLSGTGEIRLRRLFADEVIRFQVSGERPAIVDMPTLWVHSITNTGDNELMTLFWANQIFDPNNPDTTTESVLVEERAA